MVIAEIPLWISHGSEAGRENRMNLSSTTMEGNATATGTATATATASSTFLNGNGKHSHHHNSTKALASLGLWRKDRAAIYSVDVHPSQPLLCTGGGDGTVRLWSTHSLFKQQHQGGKFEKKESKEGVATAAAGYVSTSSGSDRGGGSSEDDDESASVQSKASRGSSATTNNVNANQDAASKMPPVIHDLTDVVRSRKHPLASPERPVKLPSQALASTNPQQQQQQQPPLLQHQAQQQQQRLLCTLSAHTGSSVLAVRFSCTGKLLASAGDDGCVCVYAPTEGETIWHRILLCRGHNLDAVGLAWSPDDSYLVSCSLDRETPILVWKVADVLDGKPPATSMIRQPTKVLGRNEHQSTVKGVCFDPVGSYIATSGDDPAVCIWRTHGDWGLERKIDAKDGIFRQWGADHNSVSLSSQSLFRRISWSTDGAHICSTNSVVKNKHVASTISREQWAAAGAANLVGHKQPVVVAKHAPVLLAVSGNDNSKNDDPDEEPAYATLLALGDKKGFVTIWSTRKSRPLFKLQCSENRCTVTDISWGVLPDGDLLLTVALLDGHLVALRLAVPDEVGKVLSPADQAKLFRLRYGIDTSDPSSYGRLLMDDERPKLIETALQMSLEQEAHNYDEDDDENGMHLDNDDAPPPVTQPTVNQLVVRSKRDGKKRIQPLLTTTKPSTPPAKRSKPAAPAVAATDPLENAKQIADKAAAVAKASFTAATDSNQAVPAAAATTTTMPTRVPATVMAQIPAGMAAPVSLSFSTERVHSVNLESGETSGFVESQILWTVECHNRPQQVPLGSKGPGLPCIDINLQRNGRPVWHDQIVGTSCCALAGDQDIFAVGTTDGTIQLYGSSPLNKWRGESAVRAFPPLVLGHAVVSLQIKVVEKSACLLVVTADGSFGLYQLAPTLSKILRGSILPAMTHMANAAVRQEDKSLPKLSRCQITDNGQILLLLSATQSPSGSASTHATDTGGRENHQADTTSYTMGGSIQGFVYHRELELWLRISDSRFVLSDFYSNLPLRRGKDPGPLRQLDDAVRLGSMESALKPSHRKRQDTSLSYSIYAVADGGNFVPTKAHCEDRLACALALGSFSEFRQWLGLYAKTLAASGQEPLLRTLADALLGQPEGRIWWLCSGLDAFALDGKELLRKLVLPAMSKNRSLQRLTNELAVELEP